MRFLQHRSLQRASSVLLRAGRVGDLTRRELAELIQDAWLSQASARRAAAWLRENPPA